jgi:hydrogenase maturation protease
MIAVFGIGNVLVGDDAIGPAVIAAIEEGYEIPPEVIVEDIGTPSLDLAARLTGFETVIVIDAVSAKAEPGTIRMYTLEEILEHPPGLRLSPHDPSLKETLLTSRFASGNPGYVRMVGIVPESTEAFGMSATVRDAIPRAVAAVLDELRFLGITLQPRASAGDEHHTRRSHRVTSLIHHLL